MPPVDPAAHLFHPKKKAPGQRPPPGANGAPKRPRPPRPRPKPEEDDSTALPQGEYTEYKLLSSGLNGWKYDVMKFESRKPVDITTWAMPVKLNRKEPRREEPVVVQAPVPAGYMMGPDGKPVIGVDGKPVQVDADGRPIRAGEPSSSQASSDKGKEKATPVKKRNQKKTRQVHLIPDEIRQLRREERYPWVIEDGTKSEVWVGKMEEVAKSETHAMFMPLTSNVFKFVPAHRWYKFQKKPHYHVPSLEEAETLMTQIQKNKDPERWLLRKRNGQGPSEATAAMFKSEREGSITASGSLEHQSSQSLGPGGRRLRAVDTGGLFGDDDDEEGGRRRVKRELGAEGDLDELDFEEDFADDEEKIEGEAEDEEAKEAEERIKREYKSANKTREGYIDESEEEEEEPQLSMAGKDMRKLVKKLEKNLAYDESDDDKNPYASSDDESSSEEEPPQVPQGPAIIPPDPITTSRSGSQTPAPANGSKNLNGSQTPLTVKTDTSSRPTSPVASPSHGGHSVVAKRATSPKAPKGNLNGSRASSPLAGGSGSRATSPVASGSRAASPVAQSPVPGKPNNKRKATDDPTSPTTSTGAPAKPKKRKPAPVGELDAQMLIEWLRVTPNPRTRDCIAHFSAYLRVPEDKKRFAELVKQTAVLKDNVLSLRSEFRKDGGTSTPAAAPSPGAAP